MSLFITKAPLCVFVFSLLIFTINAQLTGQWPPLDAPPPPKGEWTSLVDTSKVPVRADDIIQCPNKLDWGLSFDDGPTEYTNGILDYLESVNTTITFFVVGSRVISNPQILQRAVSAGHQIGVHTWSHTALTTQTDEEIIAEIKWTELAIYTAAGVTPKYMRPPFGDIDDRVRGILSQLGYKIVIWDKDTKDFESSQPSFQLDWIEGNFTEWANEDDPTGHISLEHDLFQKTAAQAPKVVPILQKAGFSIKPVALCVGDSPYRENTTLTTPAIPTAATTDPAQTTQVVVTTTVPSETTDGTYPDADNNSSGYTSTSNTIYHMTNNYYLLSLVLFIIYFIII